MTFLQPRERSFNRGSSPPLSSYISTNQTIMPRVAPTRRQYRKSEKWDNRHGPPQGRDKYGRFVWHRVADNRMVTIKCCVVGCFKSEGSFKTIHGLMCHLKRDHEIKPEGREQLLMQCGDVADMGDAGVGGANYHVVLPEDQENSEEEGSTDRGSSEEANAGFSLGAALGQTHVNGRSGCVANSGFLRDATSIQTDVNGKADGELRSSILSHFEIDPSVPVVSIESSEEPRVQPRGLSLVQLLVPTNPTETASGVDQNMVDAEINPGSKMPEKRRDSIKEESLSANEQSRVSSLFGGSNGGENGGEKEYGGLDEGVDDNMDIVEIVRRNTPDDEVIRRLLGGAPESAEIVRRKTPDDEVIRRLLGGVPESAFAML